MNLGKTWVKLHSKHMKYSLIHCSSKPLTRIIYNKVLVSLQIWENLLIWNYIFKSISARCSLDSFWKLFCFFFFGQSIVPEGPVTFFPIYFLSSILSSLPLFLQAFLLLPPLPPKKRPPLPWLFRIFKAVSKLWPTPCRVHESQQQPWWVSLFQQSVHLMAWATELMWLWQLSSLPFAGYWTDSSTVTT